jgi:hypothetical protein
MRTHSHTPLTNTQTHIYTCSRDHTLTYNGGALLRTHSHTPLTNTKHTSIRAHGITHSHRMAGEIQVRCAHTMATQSPAVSIACMHTHIYTHSHMSAGEI